jgi:hypothetical protein
LVVRFRRSHGIERQQLKWFTYAAALAPLPFLAHDFAPSLSGLLETLVPPLVPISVGIAILRYRLYEIDRIINRTLVYLLLTAVLGLCYAAGSLVFVLVAGTAADPPSWLVAAATLAATASNPPAPCAPNTDPSSVAVAPLHDSHPAGVAGGGVERPGQACGVRGELAAVAAEQAEVVQLGHQIRDEPAVAGRDQGPSLGLQQLGGARPVRHDRAVVVHAGRTASPAAHPSVAGWAVRVGQRPPAPGAGWPVGPYQRRIGGQLPLDQLLEFGQRQGQHLGKGKERRRHLQVESRSEGE